MRARAHQVDNHPNQRCSERVGPLQCHSWGRRRGRKRGGRPGISSSTAAAIALFLCNSATREKCVCKVKHTRRARFFPWTLGRALLQRPTEEALPSSPLPSASVRLAGASNDRMRRRANGQSAARRPLKGKCGIGGSPSSSSGLRRTAAMARARAVLPSVSTPSPFPLFYYSVFFRDERGGRSRRPVGIAPCDSRASEIRPSGVGVRCRRSKLCA